MGTKTKTDNTSSNAITFDPQSMQRYQNWQNLLFGGGGGGTTGGPFGVGGSFPGSNASITGGGGGGLAGLFSNPFGNPFFNLNLQQQTRGASQVAGRNSQNALMNFNRSGIGGGSLGGGAFQSLLAGTGRYGSGLQFQGFMNAANQAQSDRWNAAQLGSSMFQPLQTGGNSKSSTTQSTGGLGTWLPQVIGAGIGMATGGGFGALGKMFGGGGDPTANPNSSSYDPYGAGGMTANALLKSPAGMGGFGQLPPAAPSVPYPMPSGFNPSPSQYWNPSGGTGWGG
jgi:hypothetical protein